MSGANKLLKYIYGYWKCSGVDNKQISICPGTVETVVEAPLSPGAEIVRDAQTAASGFLPL